MTRDELAHRIQARLVLPNRHAGLFVTGDLQFAAGQGADQTLTKKSQPASVSF